MKRVATVAVALAVLGVLLFILGSSVVGRYVYNIPLMIATTIAGAMLFAAGTCILLYAALSKKK